MDDVVKVGIADWKVCKSPSKITTIGLGSCVGIVLYSTNSIYCGLSHIMLPSSKEINNNSNRAKFADTGIADMIMALQKVGVRPNTMLAKIAGGAAMFQFSSTSDLQSIGDRNVKAVKNVLAALRINIVAEDTGKDFGRTIIFDPTSQKLLVRSAGKADKYI
ncbi:MAG: chemotaxis protein CheD [Lachnospiraceae bacterium]|nr:chemotaxis protein CheD [Lachnospiraceae bacterium]MDE6626352.1 chemotaxis protein CheD [Lachnospiraceae bacterium]